MILSALTGQVGEGMRLIHSTSIDTNAFPCEIREGVDASFGDLESAQFYLTQRQAGSLFHMEWHIRIRPYDHVARTFSCLVS